jgi:hypothetical protein
LFNNVGNLGRNNNNNNKNNNTNLHSFFFVRIELVFIGTNKEREEIISILLSLFLCCNGSISFFFSGVKIVKKTKKQEA